MPKMVHLPACLPLGWFCSWGPLNIPRHETAGNSSGIFYLRRPSIRSEATSSSWQTELLYSSRWQVRWCRPKPPVFGSDRRL